MEKLVKPADIIPAPSSNENSFTKRILSQLREIREKNRPNRPNQLLTSTDNTNKSRFLLNVDWLHHSLPRYLKDPNLKISQPDKSDPPLQEIDLLREFYLKIAEHGLPATFETWGSSKPKPPPSGTVLIVGAGISGMAAAYELEKAGYEDVKILEMSQRFGGRVKTLDMKDGFDRGLHTDGKLFKSMLHSALKIYTPAPFYIIVYLLQLVRCVSPSPRSLRICRIVQSMSQSITSLTTTLSISIWSKFPLSTRVTAPTTASTETSYKSLVTI